MSRFKITPQLWDKIHHFASFPPTGGEYRPPPSLALPIPVNPKMPSC